MTDLLILAPLSFALAAYFTYRFRAPAERLGIVDAPGERKLHNGPTPLVGGLAMFAAFAFCALLLDSALQPYRALFAGMSLLVITGMLDDLHDLRALEKLVLQLLAAAALIFWGDLVIAHLGALPGLGHVELVWMAVPFTALCVVGLVNAVNMIDGADGLAGSVVLAMLFWLAVIAVGAEGPTVLALPVLLGCAVLGFLAFNFPVPWRPQASVFMGDSGSTMLGFAVAWLAIEVTFRQGTGVPPVVIAWILAPPVFDTMSLMLRRMLKGQSPMAPDREHLHHVFQRAGFSAHATVYVLAALSFAMGGIGVGAWWLGVPEWMLWPPLLAVLVLHFLFVQHAWRAVRLLRRLQAREADQAEG